MTKKYGRGLMTSQINMIEELDAMEERLKR